MSKAQPPSPNRSGSLPKYVGYRDVGDALGVSRRTIERMVREGKFPKPVQLTPNRVGWEDVTVTQWLAERGKGLAARAVTNPEDLSEEQIEDALQSLAAEYILKRAGEAHRDELVVSLMRRTIVENPSDWRTPILAAFDGRFDHFELVRSVLVAAWLFPSLRDVLDTGENEAAKTILSDPKQLKVFASLAMDDDTWDECQDEIERKLGRPG